ncbi:TetR/AcrR family transcriptional regulator [Teredinibacter haidensis]|uniref:TetR/AcrR family transcriptional regulator n=1 Tax=Teredinibacter haidensis TaxID=2731755 RepID=UPI000948D7CF|nr:TetR/AcrR family transcriptional regulator [Teredinibacter haidensis]
MSDAICQDARLPAQEAKRQQILRATLKLLAKQGFHGFSIKQVAKAANVAAGTVYLYFRDKQDMIEQLHMEIIQSVASATFDGWDESAPPFNRYQRLCRNLWYFNIEHPDALLCKGQFDQLPPDVLRNQYTEAQNLFAPLNALFCEGRESGELEALPNEAMFCISVDTFWQMARKQHLGMVEVNEALLEQMIDSTWRGISRNQNT